MNLKKKLLVLFCGLILLNACKKEVSIQETQNPLANKNDYSIKSGILIFKDQSSFDKVFNSLINKDETFLNNWEQKLGHQSYRKSHTIDSAEAELSIFEKDFNPIDLPHLSTILNPDGIFVIGDTFHQFKDGKEITFVDKDLFTNLTKENYQTRLANSQTKKVITVTVKDLGKKEKPLGDIKTDSYVVGEGFVQEVDCGRPERIRFQKAVITSNSFIQCVVHLNGEAFRRGGIFGSRKWYSDEMLYAGLDIAFGWAIYDEFNQYVAGYANPYVGSYAVAFNTVSWSVYGPNIYNTIGQNQYAEITYLDAHFQVQKNGCVIPQEFFK